MYTLCVSECHKINEITKEICKQNIIYWFSDLSHTKWTLKHWEQYQKPESQQNWVISTHQKSELSNQKCVETCKVFYTSIYLQHPLLQLPVLKHWHLSFFLITNHKLLFTLWNQHPHSSCQRSLSSWLTSSGTTHIMSSHSFCHNLTIR